MVCGTHAAVTAEAQHYQAYAPKDLGPTGTVLSRKRSGCQNITLAITSFDGVPCRHGYAPLLTMGTLGTDSA